jgi:HSP20 family protein
MHMTEKNSKSRKTQDSDSTALAMPGFSMPRIFEDFMRPFDEFMRPFFEGSAGSLWTELKGKEPNIDFQDRGDHYVLTAELPGFEKKDVEVRISSNVLELKGEKRTEKQSKSPDGMQTESSHSYVHRYFTLPEEVLSEKVSGTMKNGVLELKLPKKEPKAMDRSKKVELK